MSTLAISCAYSDGLDIVGDKRSGKLHSALLEKETEGVYQSWLHDTDLPNPEPATAQELFEFMVKFACNLDDVTPKKLLSMGKDREALRTLMASLRETQLRSREWTRVLSANNTFEIPSLMF
jgi:hypothetical protein